MVQAGVPAQKASTLNESFHHRASKAGLNKKEKAAACVGVERRVYLKSVVSGINKKEQ